MPTLTLSQQQARRFLLAQQGLWPPYALQGKPGILDYIRRVGCIQFDPLNIVGRNPELALQSRVADFRPGPGFRPDGGCAELPRPGHLSRWLIWTASTLLTNPAAANCP